MKALILLTKGYHNIIQLYELNLRKDSTDFEQCDSQYPNIHHSHYFAYPEAETSRF